MKAFLACVVILFCVSAYGGSDVSRDFLVRFGKNVKDFSSENIRNIRTVEDKSSAMVSVSIAIRHSGSAYNNDKLGLSALLTKMLDEGYEGIGAADFKRSLDERGVSISYSVTPDDIIVSIYSLPDSLEFALNTLGKVLSTPKVNDDVLKKAKGAMLAELDYQDSNDQESVARSHVIKTIFGKHPYGYKLDGTSSSVSAIKLSDVKNFVKSSIHKNAFVVAAAGKFDSVSFPKTIERVLISKLPAGAMVAGVGNPSSMNFTAAPLRVKAGSGKTVVGFAQKGYGLKDKNYPAYSVLISLLGRSDLEAVLMNNARSVGLSYRINMAMVSYEYADFTYGFAVVDPAKEQKITAMIKENLSNVTPYVNSGEKLESAKASELSGIAFSLVSSGDKAAFLLTTLLRAVNMTDVLMTYDAVQGVTSSDLISVSKLVLDAKNMDIVVAGD